MKQMLIAFVLVLAPPAAAQDKAAVVDKIFSWVQPGMPGCTAAASVEGKLAVSRAYGLADLERNVPLTRASVFDAGSIRKQFVAAAVLMLVAEGKLSLTDDVRKYVPQLPDYGHTITIDHLLTHTSGVRDWVPLLNFATGDPDAMSMIVRQRALNFVPGTEWSYSNSGYVLLPEVVARVSGMTFSEFLRTRVLEPLGMKASSYVDDPLVVIPNRALAYERQGTTWRQAMMLGNERGGAGALFTTAEDLVTWSDALTRGRLGAFVTEKMSEPARLANGRQLNYGRGTMFETNYGGRLLWHGGSAEGYKSVVGRFVDRDISVAVVCNAGEAADARTQFAGRIFDAFMADKGLTRPAAPPAPPNADGVTEDDLRGKAGVFLRDGTGDPLRLAVNGGRLAIAGGGALVAMSNDLFRNVRPSPDFMSMAEIELCFASNDAFTLTTKEGETLRYRRAPRYTPAAEALKAYEGLYESDELRAAFTVTATAQGIALQLNERQGGAPFAPIAPDLFQAGTFTVRFERDASGKVTGFDFSTPALRHVRFTRTRN